MPLSTLDLVSTLFGRLSFGFSVWFAIPQIGEAYKKKARKGGPSFILLWLWLIGDIAQTIGLFVIGGLATQKASGICFAVSSFIMMMQQYYYHGLIPFTQYRKERKESRKETKPVVESLISNVHRPPAYSPELAKAPTRHVQQNRFYDLEKGRKTVSHSEKGLYRSRLRKQVNRPFEKKFSSQWKDFDGWRVNLSGFCLLAAIMLAVWFANDFASRETTELIPAIPPSTTMEKYGWYLGWIGTSLYTFARWHQLAMILIRKSVAAIAAFCFASLVLQNIAMLISILAVSHTTEAIIAQAPYLTNLACALSGDVVFLILYYLYRNNPPPSGSKRPWSDPDWMYRDSEPHASTGERALLQKHQQDLHRLLLPTTERQSDKDVADRPLLSRQQNLRRQVDQNGRKLLRDKIEQLVEKALPLEEKWKKDSNSLPFMIRGKAALKLDRLEKDELGLWDRLNASQAEFGGREEEEEHHKWLTRTEEKRRKLQELREERRQSQPSASGRNSSSSERSSSESPQDSVVRQSVHRAQQRGSVRNLSVGKGIAHPRRGVGTSSEVSSNEEWSS
ncbi:hypothetical protein JCM5350_007098 [Sporobolomyces pararoseus]